MMEVFAGIGIAATIVAALGLVIGAAMLITAVRDHSAMLRRQGEQMSDLRIRLEDVEFTLRTLRTEKQ